MMPTGAAEQKTVVGYAEMLDELFEMPGPYSLYLDMGGDEFFRSVQDRWLRLGPEQQSLDGLIADRTYRPAAHSQYDGDVTHIKEDIKFGPALRAAPNASEITVLHTLWAALDLPTIEPSRIVVQATDPRSVLLSAINQSTGRPSVDPAAREMAFQKLEAAECQPNFIVDEGDRLVALWVLEHHVPHDPFAEPMFRALQGVVVDRVNLPISVMQRLCNKLGGNSRHSIPHTALIHLPGVRRFDVRVGSLGRFDVTATRLHGGRVAFEELNQFSKVR
jgi:hypothetical protein